MLATDSDHACLEMARCNASNANATVDVAPLLWGDAGALDALASQRINPDAVVVCLVTGSGFKDGPSVDLMLDDRESPVVSVDDFEHDFV